MVVLYRNATIADTVMLQELGRRSFTETFGHLYKPEDLEAYLLNHTEEKWRAELADPAFAVRVAEMDGEAIAYAKVGPPVLPFMPEGVATEIRQFYVLQPWHGRGIAQQLMQWVLATAEARGADELYLSVFIDNHRARRFYEGYGFRFVCPNVFMVGNHQDEDHILRLSSKEVPFSSKENLQHEH